MEWIDIVDPTLEDLAAVANQYGLDDGTFDEAHRRAARPTLQVYPDHAYLVAFSGDLAEIDMFIGPTWLVTVRRHDPSGQEWSPDEAQHRYQRSKGIAGNSGKLLLTFIENLVDGYFDTTDELEEQIEELEERIFTDTSKTERTIQQDLFGLRRRMLELRRVVMPLREVLAAMSRGEVDSVTGPELAQCRDIYDKLLRAVDVIDEMRELVGNAVDAHLAVMSNQMNLVMKRLTAWGSIVFGATLIAGIYGMNFTHMPELSWQYGYPLALGAMLFTSVVQYKIFKKRDWL